MSFILGFMVSVDSVLYAEKKISDDTLESSFDPQTRKALLTVVSIEWQDIPFEEALKILADKGRLKLNYNRSRIPVDKKVSAKMYNVPIIKALLKILDDTGTGIKVTHQGLLAIIPAKENHGEIRGTVIDKKTGESLAGANIEIMDQPLGAATDVNGKFLIAKLPAGVYSLKASMMGYGSKQIENVIITDDASVRVHFELADTLLSLQSIIVTPGYFSLMEKHPISSEALMAEDIRGFPQIGEDIHRAVTRLPGVTGNDLSAKFNIRGGAYDEVLVMLDGMELYDAFHLKDLDGFFSIIDVDAIRSIDMMTGAFPVEYGNHQSGVFDMRTVNPTSETSKTSLAISFLNARFLNQGASANGKWQWLFLARKGYLDLLLKLLNPDDKVEPVYYDLLSKIQCSINSRHLISANVLASNDNVILTETHDGLQFHSRYGNLYGWVNWRAQFQSKLSAQSVLYYGRVSQEGKVQQTPMQDAEFEGEVKANKKFDFYGFKQDWNFELSKNMLLKWGFDVKQFSAGYDFYFSKPITIGHLNDNEIYNYQTTINKADPDGRQFGLYFADRIRFFNPFTMEIGIRYDHASWTEDKTISPRINMMYDISTRTALRIGWGKFYQTQGIHQLNAFDGDINFYPAELSEHRVVGIEHAFKNGLNLRFEAYQKKLSHIRPRYQNFRGFTLNPIGAIHDDRIRVEPEWGESNGFELYLKHERGAKLSWWASYSYALVRDMINGRLTPRDFDQRHTIYLDVTYHPSPKWRLNVAWQYHTGWPYTESIFHIVNQWSDGYIDYEWLPGPLNAGRLPDYHRLDLRITRIFYTSNGRISTFFEIRNLYNRQNIREYKYEYVGYQNGQHVAKRTGVETLLPMLPSFGISWEF